MHTKKTINSSDIPKVKKLSNPRYKSLPLLGALLLVCAFFLLLSCGGFDGKANDDDNTNANSNICTFSSIVFCGAFGSGGFGANGGSEPTSLQVLRSSTLAGMTSLPSHKDGPGTSALFATPYGVVIAPDDSVYIADGNNRRIRKITQDTSSDTTVANVSTFAGSGSRGSADGQGAAATFDYPSGMAFGNDGNIYVADMRTNRIRKILLDTSSGTTLGEVSTVTSTVGEFNNPYGIAFDHDGNLYVADTNNNRIRKLVLDTSSDITVATVSTFAGSGSTGSANGVGTAATFNAPRGLAVGPDGSIYVSDSGNNLIRKIEPDTATVTTIAGTGEKGFDNGLGTDATFNAPRGLAIGPDNNLYVADFDNDSIRKIVLSDEAAFRVTTFVKNLESPNEIAFSPDARVAYITGDSGGIVYKLSLNGFIASK